MLGALADFHMSVREVIEAKLGHPVRVLATVSPLQPQPMFRVCYTAERKLAVHQFTPSDTAIVFHGLFCPFEDAALFIEKDVAVDWGLL